TYLTDFKAALNLAQQTENQRVKEKLNARKSGAAYPSEAIRQKAKELGQQLENTSNKVTDYSNVWKRLSEKYSRFFPIRESTSSEASTRASSPVDRSPTPTPPGPRDHQPGPINEEQQEEPEEEQQTTQESQQPDQTGEDHPENENPEQQSEEEESNMSDDDTTSRSKDQKVPPPRKFSGNDSD